MFDTFFQKKTLYASITGLFLGLILMGCPFFVSASGLSDNFDDYTLGGLENDPHDWAGSLTDVDVVDTGCFAGRCLKASAGAGIYKIDTGLETGEFSIYTYLHSRGVTDNLITIFSTDVHIPFALAWGSGGDLRLLKLGGWTAIETGTLLNDTWNLLTCEWTSSEVRCKSGTNEYSSWYDFYEEYDPAGMEWYSLNGEYFDNVSFGAPSCGIDNCSLCETSEECIGAGCIYEYNTGFARWECHQEWIPYVPGCGTGFQESCYGCYTQETCEDAIPTGVCEWVDRGYGIGCYPTEEVPPEAVWEEPKLENCSELSGVEKWLCEIKNWLAGLFMPTQEKVNELNLTIKNFKAKFPFNYANSLSAFFTTIKTGLETDKDIPVELFGHSGDVNFDFLNATSTIGGTSETMKNILFDCTTALIIFAFVLWIISFIKRIF